MNENTCACGCGSVVGPKQKYVRGHDARHASKLWQTIILAWADTLAADKAPDFNVGTVKFNQAAERDLRRHARDMEPVIEKALAEVPVGRRAWLEAKIADSAFARYAQAVVA